MCGGDNKHHVVVEVTHTALNKQTKHEGVWCVTCVLARLRAHYTHTPFQNREKKKNREQRTESSVRRWRRSSR
nr:MAG TPA: hypothetical protein [Caudoviricetes sp.]